jgi:hypothetical protein
MQRMFFKSGKRTVYFLSSPRANRAFEEKKKQEKEELTAAEERERKAKVEEEYKLYHKLRIDQMNAAILAKKAKSAEASA